MSRVFKNGKIMQQIRQFMIVTWLINHGQVATLHPSILDYLLAGGVLLVLAAHHDVTAPHRNSRVSWRHQHGFVRGAQDLTTGAVSARFVFFQLPREVWGPKAPLMP